MTSTATLRLLCYSTIMSATLFAQDLRYLTYEKDLPPSNIYHERRERLMSEVGSEATVILFSATEKNRNGDGDYPYRQDDNFYYLTGCDEPNSVLVMRSKGILLPNDQDSTKSDTMREILFVQPRDPRWEQWTGRRLGPAGAEKLLGFQRSMTNDMFAKRFQAILPDEQSRNLYCPPLPDRNEGSADILGSLRECLQKLKSNTPQVEVHDPTSIIRRYRSVKSSDEIVLISKAAHISAIAHRQAMMSCKPGMSEFEIQAVYEYVFRKLGSEFNAYPCIVGAAENSIILHYESNRRPINDGDIVLADCGAEYHNYASDVTRTFPANGKFSDAQRHIYQIVLDAQNAAIALMKPGVAWREVSSTADSILQEGLFSLGFIKEKNRREFRKFYPHGLGHAVGLDVHDVNAAVLMPGMVYTLEPGLYIPEHADNVDAKYSNIGVRIEDDILITADGHVNLSAEAPRGIDEIESLMKKRGIGDMPVD